MSPKAHFSERILYKPAKTVHLDKTEARWYDGVWLGVLEGTDEHIIGTCHGVVKCRAIHPRAEGQDWNALAINQIKGAPWQPNPNKPGFRISTAIVEVDSEDPREDVADGSIGHEFQVPAEEDEDEMRKMMMKEQAKREVEDDEWCIPREMYVTAKDCRRYGYTEGCLGCKFLQGFVRYQASHNHQCRSRIIEAMTADPDNRHRAINAREKIPEKKLKRARPNEEKRSSVNGDIEGKHKENHPQALASSQDGERQDQSRFIWWKADVDMNGTEEPPEVEANPMKW